MPDWLTDSLTTLKDRATQLHIKYKSGALVTQYLFKNTYVIFNKENNKNALLLSLFFLQVKGT